MDVLRIRGLGRVDGEYPCDLVAILLDLSSEDALTVREAQFIRDFSGARGYEIVDAFDAGDMSVRAAVAMVVLRRNDKPLLNETVMDLKAGWATFEMDVEEVAEEFPPTNEGAQTPTPSNGSGLTSRTPSAYPDDDLKVIGVPA